MPSLDDAQGHKEMNEAKAKSRRKMEGRLYSQSALFMRFNCSFFKLLTVKVMTLTFLFLIFVLLQNT